MGKKKVEAAQPQASERRPPAHECRIGRIRATVWENQHPEQGRWFSVTITRSYKQGEQYKTANSFGRDDLLVVAEVSRLAFLWIAQQNGTNLGGGTTEPPSDDVPI
jgi:hypothetical protein